MKLSGHDDFRGRGGGAKLFAGKEPSTPLAMAFLLATICLMGTAPLAAQSLRLRVDPDDVVHTLAPWFHGVNIIGNAWDVYADSPGAEEALRNGGFAGMRFPGGQPADLYWWDCPYWTPDSGDPAIDPCPEDRIDTFLGQPVSFDDAYLLGPVSHDSSSSGPDLGAEPFLVLLRAHAEYGGTYPSEGRMSTADLDLFSSAVAGSARRLLIQTNVFATNSTLAARRTPPGRAQGSVYAARWAEEISRRRMPADFEIGNEPEHFVLANRHEQGSPWDWLQTYIGAFRQQALHIRRRNRSARVFGPATNIGESGAGVWPPSSAGSPPVGLVDTTAPKLSDSEPLGYRSGHRPLGSGDDTVGWRVLDNWLRLTSQAPTYEQPDGVSIHYYPGTRARARIGDRPTDGGDGFAWSTQRSAAQAFHYHYDRVKELVQHWYGRQLPIIVSEWHSGHVVTDAQRVSQNGSVGSALQQLDTVATFAQVGVESHSFYSLHDVGPGQRFWWNQGPVALYGMLTGITDQHQTTSGEPARAPDEASPTYYAMAMWGALMGNRVLAPPVRFGSFDEGEVSSYATKDSAGNLQVLVLNKTSDPVSLRIEFTDVAENRYPTSSATWLSPAGLASDDTILTSGASILNGSPWPASMLSLPEPIDLPGEASGLGFDHSIPPYTAIVLDFDPEPIDVSIPIDDCRLDGTCGECGDNGDLPCLEPGG